MRMMHVNIGCSDFDRSYDFYTRVVGMHPLTAKVLQTQAVDPVDLAHVSRSGKRVGEHRTEGEDAKKGGIVLGTEDGDATNRAVLLYWEDQPTGPFVDLQEWKQKIGAGSVTRDAKELGLGRLAIFVDDIEPHKARLAREGVELVGPMQTMEIGVTDMKIACFRDPDGTLLEYVEMVGGGWNA
jgi:catechol 2,3-dioxygenase-like lactoylglutathione lyase family enzyme